MVKNTLEADSILYKIGDKSLLTDIFLRCSTGEVVGLLGRNGCGKSTLLKIIFGTLPTYNKHIRLNGQVFKSPYKTEIISYLPQDNFLPQSLTLNKIIELFIPDTAKQNLIQENERLRKHLTKKVYILSSGERRYFEILLLLNLNSDFILLDEPFSAIEPLYKVKIRELLLEYRAMKGIIVTDHDYRQIIEVSDRIILLKDGCTKPIKNLIELEDWNYLPDGALDPK